MAAFDLEEQEQLSQIKGWWEQYGKLVTGAAVAAALVSVGWQGWNWHQGKQTAEAAALYAVVQQAAASKNAQQAKETAGLLIEGYGGTVYADLGALLAAKIQIDAGDSKNARAQLGWAAENARDPLLKDLARLRLAALLLDEKSYDEALARLQATPDDSLVARFADLRGDVLSAQGKTDEARKAYQVAVDDLTKTSRAEAVALREIVQAKLDVIGGGQ